MVDCRKCGNCDMENDRCRLYGSDPAEAVRACASKNFGAYRPDCHRERDTEKPQPRSNPKI